MASHDAGRNKAIWGVANGHDWQKPTVLVSQRFLQETLLCDYSRREVKMGLSASGNVAVGDGGVSVTS